MSTTAHFSLDHYEHMVRVGAFAGEFEKDVELLRGRIVSRHRRGPLHCHMQTQLTDWSYQVVPRDQMAICVQRPIRIHVSDSEPQPDLIWAIRRDFAKRHPEPHEIVLLVEVAESSLDVDRGTKLGVYAEAGIADYWIVNIEDEQIEVYRNPAGCEYRDKLVFRGDTPVSPLALPEAALLPSRLFG